MPEDFEFRYHLMRWDWLRTEWPAILFWCVPGFAFLAAILSLVFLSFNHPILITLWLFLTPVWWFIFGLKSIAILFFLLRGREDHVLTIQNNGVIFVSTNGSEPVYAHWKGIQNNGVTFLMWGADGRYRLIIPRKAVSNEVEEAFQKRVGISLRELPYGKEILLRKPEPIST